MLNFWINQIFNTKIRLANQTSISGPLLFFLTLLSIHRLYVQCQHNSALFSVNTITELDEEFPGVSKIIETWFANYKGKGKIKTNGFAGVEVSMTMLRESVNEFKKNNK